jgi:CBS domain-containing protein
MAQIVREVMTQGVVVVPTSTTLTEAAQHMRDQNIGDVLVMDQPGLQCILTDRDIVIRATASGLSPDEVTVGEICTTNVTALNAEDPIEHAVDLMRERAVRRLPVVEDGRIVGIVSLGDLAIEEDRSSALADISAAEPQI